MYSCEIPDCSWSGAIRSKVKNKDSDFYGKKVCPRHAQELNNVLYTRTELKRSRKSIKRMTEKTKVHKKKVSEKRDKYFEHHIEICECSEESGAAIPAPSRANICHIFPKRTYSSVQADLENYVYLTLEEHTRFDQLLDRMDFETLEKEFKCWGLVISRVEKLLPRVVENKTLSLKFRELIDK